MSHDLPAALAAGGFLDWTHKFFFRQDARALHGADSDEIYMGIFWLSAVIFIVLMVLMVYWTVKYRRRPGTIAPSSPSHNTAIEVAWTVIPLGILSIMFFKGFKGYMNGVVSPAGAVEMSLTAQKWDWLITYPGGETSPLKKLVGDKQVPIFVMPAETPVKLRMRSIDVIHSFWVPDFRGKFDVMPNRYTTYWFQADKPIPTPGQEAMKFSDGTEFRDYEDHWVFCAEYCGDSHSEMSAIIRVVPEEIYQKSIKAWGVEGLTPVELGKRVHAQRCITCHTTDGKPGTGPSWKDLYGHAVDFADGSSIAEAEMTDDASFANYIRESILNPGKRIVKGFPNQMTNFMGVISDKEIDGVIAYMKTLSEKGAGKGAEAPAEKK